MNTQVEPQRGRFVCPGRACSLILCSTVAALALIVSPALAEACSTNVNPIIRSVSTKETLIGTVIEFKVDTSGYKIPYQITYGLESDEENSLLPRKLYFEPEFQTVSELIYGLRPGKTYMYRLEVSDLVQGECREGSFTTPLRPEVEISPASEVPYGVKLNGLVYPNGGETRYTFEYGPTTTYGTRSFELTVPAGDLALPVEAVIRDGSLIPYRKYDFRLIAENSVGRVESPNLTFIAPKIEEPPLAIANPPIQTSSTAATLQGAIDPGGLSSTYRFEFGKTLAYGTDAPETEATIPAGDGLVVVEAPATGLQPNTTYFCRLVAKNAKGESKSLEEVFTTPPEPPLATATAYAQTAHGYLLSGTVEPNGEKTSYYFEFGAPRPAA